MQKTQTDENGNQIQLILNSKNTAEPLEVMKALIKIQVRQGSKVEDDHAAKSSFDKRNSQPTTQLSI